MRAGGTCMYIYKYILPSNDDVELSNMTHQHHCRIKTRTENFDMLRYTTQKYCENVHERIIGEKINKQCINFILSR